MVAGGHEAPVGQWTTGLCGCFEDCHSCCCVCCCPCVIVGRNAEIASDGRIDSTTACCLFYLIQVAIGCGCIYSASHRAMLRGKYGLPASPCDDYLVHCCCLSCALCQENRELKNRGWDPKLGYAANVSRFQQTGMTPPPGIVMK